MIDSKYQDTKISLQTYKVKPLGTIDHLNVLNQDVVALVDRQDDRAW